MTSVPRISSAALSRSRITAVNTANPLAVKARFTQEDDGRQSSGNKDREQPAPFVPAAGQVNDQEYYTCARKNQAPNNRIKFWEKPRFCSRKTPPNKTKVIPQIKLLRLCFIFFSPWQLVAALFIYSNLIYVIGNKIPAFT